MMWILAVPFASASSGIANERRIAGSVTDAITHQPVRQAIVAIVEIQQKTITDDEGRFAFDLMAPGTYTLSVHHVAYRALELALTVGAEPEPILCALEPAILQTDEMVVRCTRTPSVVSNSPYPLNVVEGDRLSQSHAVTLADVLERTPGLALVRDGAWETAIAIRGLSRSNIVTVVDDARIETANDIAGGLSLINVHDLERAEVMKSPASAQHGTGAIGGVVQLVSKRPFFTEHFQMNGELTSDFSSVDDCFSQYGALQWSFDRVAFRFSGGVRNAGDTETPAGPLANSRFHDFSLSGSLGFALGGDQSATLTYQRVQANDTGIPGGAPIAEPATAKYTLARRELVGLEYLIPHVSALIPLVTLRAQRQEIARAVEILNANGSVATPHAVHTMLSAQAEARLTPLPEMVLTAGTEVWQRKLDSRRERRVAGTVTGERPVPLSWYSSAGLFVHSDWAVKPGRLTLTCGARYDWIHVTNEGVLNPEYSITGGIVNTAPANQKQLWVSGSQADGSWSADAGLRYALTTWLDLTALGAAAFRSPSLEERFEFIDLGSIVYIGNPALSAEKSLCGNAGIRIHTDVLRVHADLFLNSMSNLVSQMPGQYEGRKAYYRTNIGRAELHGFEIDAERAITDWSVLNITAAYVRGKDTRNNVDLPQIPPFNGQVELRGIVGDVGTISVSTPWAAAQTSPGAGEGRTPGYVLLNVGFIGESWGLGGTRVSVRAEARNLLNKEFRNHLSTLRGNIRLEPGRSFLFSATFAF
jgi:hemoglobin/transferrin/lactoferrin receptor protein